MALERLRKRTFSVSVGWYRDRQLGQLTSAQQICYFKLLAYISEEGYGDPEQNRVFLPNVSVAFLGRILAIDRKILGKFLENARKKGLLSVWQTPHDKVGQKPHPDLPPDKPGQFTLIIYGYYTYAAWDGFKKYGKSVANATPTDGANATPTGGANATPKMPSSATATTTATATTKKLSGGDGKPPRPREAKSKSKQEDTMAVNTGKLVALFVQQYNQRYPDTPMDAPAALGAQLKRKLAAMSKAMGPDEAQAVAEAAILIWFQQRRRDYEWKGLIANWPGMVKIAKSRLQLGPGRTQSGGEEVIVL